MSNLTPRGTIKGTIRSGGGGGVTDYDQLTGRPSINHIMLTGDKAGHDLGLMNTNDIDITKIYDVSHGYNYNVDILGETIHITDQTFKPATSGGAGASGLVPRPSAEDTGKILSNEGWITTPEGYTPPNYSTSEQKTGQKWIDGKDIYFKSDAYPIPSGQGQHIIESSVTTYIDKLLDIKLCMYYSDGSYQYSPAYISSNAAAYISINNNDLAFNSINENLASYTAYYTIYYTKN